MHCSFCGWSEKEFDHVVFAISPTIIKSILSNKTPNEIKIYQNSKFQETKLFFTLILN